jgi:hypothetical protein
VLSSDAGWAAWLTQRSSLTGSGKPFAAFSNSKAGISLSGQSVADAWMVATRPHSYSKTGLLERIDGQNYM